MIVEMDVMIVLLMLAVFLSLFVNLRSSMDLHTTAFSACNASVPLPRAYRKWEVGNANARCVRERAEASKKEISPRNCSGNFGSKVIVEVKNEHGTAGQEHVNVLASTTPLSQHKISNGLAKQGASLEFVDSIIERLF